MYRQLLLWFCLLPALLNTAAAEDAGSAAKELSGMSIVGNDEAPKALYLVPWKSSEIGVETDLSMRATESAMPVDRDVFLRHVGFFEISAAGARRDQ
jgi:hypothetical protein